MPAAFALDNPATWTGLLLPVLAAILVLAAGSVLGRVAQRALLAWLPRLGGNSATLAGLVETALREASRGDAGEAHARVVEAAEAELLRQAMQLAGGNQSRVARWLGLSRLTLREKLQRLGLRPAREGGDDSES